MTTETKSLPLELDVYDFILDGMAASNSNASGFLRQQLRMPTAPKPTTTAPTNAALDAVIASERFRYARGVVGKFLVLLSWLHEQHKSSFGVVENIRGRGRLYFAKSPEPLNNSGRSVNPKKIPGSDFWVITTSPTPLKQETLGNVMKAFDYSAAEIAKAKAAIDQ